MVSEGGVLVLSHWLRSWFAKLSQQTLPLYWYKWSVLSIVFLGADSGYKITLSWPEKSTLIPVFPQQCLLLHPSCNHSVPDDILTALCRWCRQGWSCPCCCLWQLIIIEFYLAIYTCQSGSLVSSSDEHLGFRGSSLRRSGTFGQHPHVPRGKNRRNEDSVSLSLWPVWCCIYLTDFQSKLGESCAVLHIYS